MKANDVLTKREELSLFKYACNLMRFIGRSDLDAQGVLRLIGFVLCSLSVKESASHFEVYAKARKALSYKISGGGHTWRDAVAGVIPREELKNLV